MTSTQEIQQLENSNYKKLKKHIKSSLIEVGDFDPLVSKLPNLSKDLQIKVKELRKEAQKLADENSEEKHRDKQERNLIITVASLNLYRLLGSSMVLKQDQEYSQAVEETLEENDQYLQRLNTTETFDAYNQKFLANHVEEMVLWNAELDARTCPTCEERDGRLYLAEEVPDFHINCRCFITGEYGFYSF